jgi:Domain of unknown function (DUF4389)
MKPLRVLLLVLGSVIALLGLGLVGAGASIGWAAGTQRDEAGFFTTTTDRYESTGYAITSDKIDLGEPGPDDWWAERDLATVRVVADSAGDTAVFVGIGPEADVEAYLADVPHDEVTSVEFRPFSAHYRPENTEGRSMPAPPTAQSFWVAQASGAADQTITWNLEPGDWAIVVMNADATENVAADIEVGGQVDYLVALAIGLGVVGLLMLASGTALIIGGVVTAATTSAAGPGGQTAVVGQSAPLDAPAAVSPLRLDGHLDSGLSRWKWLVKWLLALPHAIVLVVLWIAFVALTVVAFVAILFTGRYPRAIFEFNVGVLRWTWRVGYYATSVLGTDRYPPFTLAADDYPAQLDVAYPEHLSRGLVLVKSWLLAIPHLLVVGVLVASGTFGDADGVWFVFGGGLLGILVVIAAITLTVSGGYPRGLYDLIMGVNRWLYRVIVYVALMTDVYPPFRLDQGGRDPASPTDLTSPSVPPNTPA